jgi:hypothetical protein
MDQARDLQKIKEFIYRVELKRKVIVEESKSKEKFKPLQLDGKSSIQQLKQVTDR